MSNENEPSGHGGLPTRSRGGRTEPEHDERLRKGIIDTEISRLTAVLLTAFFVVSIWAVPIVQIVLEKQNDEEPLVLELFENWPTSESLKRFEDDLEKASYVKEWVQPRVQAVLTRFGRLGNPKAVVAPGGWLFYTPGVNFVSGPGFLHEDVLATRRGGAPSDTPEEAIHPDPRPAILAFHAALQRRGIALIVFPVPDKATLQPGQLHGRRSATSGAVARNLDWEQWLTELRARGILVFDPAPAQLEAEPPQRFMVQDTHWTPAWMEQVAAELAQFAQRSVPLAPPATPKAWQVVDTHVERVGDIVDMLKLPKEQTLFQSLGADVHALQDASGAAWEPNENADVLLLGDSFTNVYSLPYMGWGASAGLAPHLAQALGRDLDVIAQNDSGAYATRQALARQLGAGEDRLAGKKVVIWEFAARELAVGNWKPVNWPEASPP